MLFFLARSMVRAIQYFAPCAPYRSEPFSETVLRIVAKNSGCRNEVILHLCLDLSIPRSSKHCPSVVLEKQDITTCEKEQRQRRKPQGRRLTGLSKIGCRYGSRGRELLLIKTLI